MITDLTHALEVFRLPLTQKDAQDFLELAQSVARSLDLFEYFFPWEYARSLAQADPLFPLRGQAYSLHEMRFFHLVADRLFPLDWLLDDVGDSHRWSFSLPITPLNELNMAEEYIEDLRLGWQLMFYLVELIETDFFVGRVDPELFATPIEPGKVDRRLFDAGCSQVEAPLSFFAVTMEILWHDTGSVWLDASTESYEEVAWNRENVAALGEQYQAYQELTKQADQFLDWLEADLVNHFAEVLTLWNQTILDSQKLPEE